MTNNERNARIAQLVVLIADAKLEIANIEKSSLNPNSAEDVDDAYQARLEYRWYMDELNDNIKSWQDELDMLNH